LEMWRVLKPTGSLYLHCDPTASHYLKAALDAIFGWKNYRNEIIWHYDGPQRPSDKNFATKHDVIHRYTKTDRFTYVKDGIRPLTQLNDDERKKYKQDENGNYYYDTPRGDYTDKSIERLKTENRIRYTRTGNIRVKHFLFTDEHGNVCRRKSLHDVWHDIPSIGHAGGNERTGYPTQKPLALYRRIIAASSNEGDMVLDPFCGCATTPVAAEQLKRQWVGMDIWDGAEQQVRTRLRKEWLFTPEDSAKVMFPHIVHIMTEPPTRTDDAQPAAPFLRVKQAHEPPGPKMSRAEIYVHLLEQHGARCQGCYREFDDPRYLQLDHNVPRSDGGLNHISNRILLCGPCNRLKSNIYTLSGLRRQNKKLGYMRQ
ncbi:MAG: DNA methyltransferase, partial [Chloroflexi bacterium]|nr:DNA methyltransferase [Chloroflexota bacterium]MCY4246755.1 DNA methyltransferase [Chloroflexota bacterium]